MNKPNNLLILKSDSMSLGMRKRSLHIATIAMLACALSACDEWGEKDPPAGGQIYPTLTATSTLPFNEELDQSAFKLSGTPTVQDDDTLGVVLALNGGILGVTNALQHAESGVGITMWVKEVEVSANSLLFAFADDSNLSGSYVGVNAKGQLIVDGTIVDAAQNAITDTMLISNKWRYVAFDISKNGYKIYSDGQLIYENEQDLTEVIAKMVAAQNFYIGAGNTTEYLVDNVKIYRNTITAKEAARPTVKIKTDNGGGNTIKPYGNPIYFNDFENGVGDAEIYGNGSIEDKGDVWGGVFSNALDGMRTNYLTLPEDVFTHSADSKAVSIGVWVNRGNETVSSHYMWSPLFTAYASQATENTWPMLACQYRGVLQVNCTTWSDYTDAENVDGANHIYHDATDWLADGEWHYYTATFTETTANVYFDGELKNSWVLDGERSAAGLFSNGADLKWICLGGNQAWTWGDPDPGFWFDDIAIWNKELSQEEIKNVMLFKQ